MQVKKEEKGLQLTFNFRYFLTSVLLFTTEVLIATTFRDIFFVRAYLGDVIVVVLIYTLIKSFFNIQNDVKLIFGILLFSFMVEFAQYFNIAEKLGFQAGSIMYIIIGNSFSWIDRLCYSIGCLILFLFVKFTEKQSI